MDDFKVVSVIKMPKVDLDKSWSKSSAKNFKRNFNQARQIGVTKAATALQEGLYQALKSPQWSWPRDTKRVNGTTAGTVRDIYDTGTLYASQKVRESHQVTQSKLTVSYSAPHAALVHYGGVVRPYGNKNAADVLIPARPWVEAVINGTYGQEQVNVGLMVVEEIKKIMGEWVTTQ